MRGYDAVEELQPMFSEEEHMSGAEQIRLGKHAMRPHPVDHAAEQG